MQTIEKTEVVKASTWKEFQLANGELPLRDLQNAWAELCKARQTELAARYESAQSAIEFKAQGRIALSGKHVGTRKLAAIKRVVATGHELEAQRLADRERSAKRDGRYVQLIAEVK